MHLACIKGHTNIVKYLLYEFDQSKIDANAKFEGKSPLDLACFYGHVELAKVLLNYEDTKNQRKEEAGKSGLHYACENGQMEIVKLLMREKVPMVPMKCGQTPLICTCTYHSSK